LHVSAQAKVITKTIIWRKSTMRVTLARFAVAVVLILCVISTQLVVVFAANIPKPSNFSITPPFRGSTALTTNSPAHTDNSNRPGYAQDYFAIDFMMPQNANVYPIASGRVVYAGMAAGDPSRCTQWANYGRIIYIDHGNGYTSLYAHLSSTNVSAGTTVTTATVIGKVGKSTCANNAGMAVHVHVSAYRNAKFAGGPYGGDSIELQPFTNCKLSDNSSCTNLYRYRKTNQSLTMVYTTGSTPPTPTVAPAALTIISPSENASTSNGLIRVTVQGGVAPYYYEIWHDGQSPFIYEWRNEATYQPSDLGWSQGHSGRLCARVKDSRGVTTSTRCFTNRSTTVSPTPVPAPSLGSCANAQITNFTASDRTNRDAIKIEWTSVQCGNNTKTYRVHIDNPGNLLVGNLTSSNYRHTGLSSGRTKTYFVVVCAIENGARVCSQPARATGRTR
jgi:murein DD-endopeptidase MepM/ murein hydrolase activator NlpD